jgi:hypothetical protein
MQCILQTLCAPMCPPRMQDVIVTRDRLASNPFARTGPTPFLSFPFRLQVRQYNINNPFSRLSGLFSLHTRDDMAATLPGPINSAPPGVPNPHIPSRARIKCGGAPCYRNILAFDIRRMSGGVLTQRAALRPEYPQANHRPNAAQPHTPTSRDWLRRRVRGWFQGQDKQAVGTMPNAVGPFFRNSIGAAGGRVKGYSRFRVCICVMWCRYSHDLVFVVIRES